MKTLLLFYSYETADGTIREEQGEQGQSGTVVRGRYAYRDNGVLYSVTYTSDENGFVPVGEHIPKPDVDAVVTAEEISAPLPDDSRPVEPLPLFHFVDESNDDGTKVQHQLDLSHLRRVPDSSLLRSESTINPDGSYHYRYIYFFTTIVYLDFNIIL